MFIRINISHIQSRRLSCSTHPRLVFQVFRVCTLYLISIGCLGILLNSFIVMLYCSNRKVGYGYNLICQQNNLHFTSIQYFHEDGKRRSLYHDIILIMHLCCKVIINDCTKTKGLTFEEILELAIFIVIDCRSEKWVIRLTPNKFWVLEAKILHGDEKPS